MLSCDLQLCRGVARLSFLVHLYQFPHRVAMELAAICQPKARVCILGQVSANAGF
jgi:hypothetical protein